jgi:diaminobutyrate-2-oxoglutarate transaminase
MFDTATVTVAPFTRGEQGSGLEVLEQSESAVRSYVRSFPVKFSTARGPLLIDAQGREYIDFLAGAGSINYGHNNPVLKEALIDYISADGIVHSLDLATDAKIEFIETFRDLILAPRGLDYKFQFTGPTGANAVEAAIKVARRATGRTNVLAFTHGYHGLSLGALAVTAAHKFRAAGGLPMNGGSFAAYEGYYGPEIDTIALLARQLGDPSSGLDLPAAIIVEGIQGEGGVNTASPEWLRRLSALAGEYRIPLILDEIQTGCGRTGDFFSFDESGIRPDIVVLSKSLSGYGLPMSLTLISPELDVWQPGEHTGTFRGNNLAFVCASSALRGYWVDDYFVTEVRRKGELLGGRLRALALRHPGLLEARGRGLFHGLASLTDPDFASRVSREAFKHGVVIETAGAYDEVLKFLPVLTIDDETLLKGLEIVEAAVEAQLTAA